MDQRSWFNWSRREGSACLGVRLVIPYTISWVHVRACSTRRRKQKTCSTPYQSRAKKSLSSVEAHSRRCSSRPWPLVLLLAVRQARQSAAGSRKKKDRSSYQVG